MLWFMSRCHNKDIFNNVIFAFKMSLLSERHLMTVVINMHKPCFIFKTYVMSWFSVISLSVLCTPLQVKSYPKVFCFFQLLVEHNIIVMNYIFGYSAITPVCNTYR